MHVWRARTSRSARTEWRSILSAEERKQADRFVFSQDCNNFTVTRAMLRIIIGQYLDIDSRLIRFELNAHGKPSISDSLRPVGINFNVTHSGDWALLAFGLSAELGIDVECLRIERSLHQLAKLLHSPDEQPGQVGSIDKRALLQAWTRREAIGKALGVGISVTTGVCESAMSNVAHWSINDIEIDADHVAAVAVRSAGIELRLWECQS